MSNAYDDAFTDGDEPTPNDENFAKMLVMNTSHVTPDTLQMAQNNQLPGRSMAHQYGVQTFVPDEDAGAPGDMIPIYALARDNDCEWAYFDVGAPTVPGLPTYDDLWESV